ncbi:MAG TPA: hypothetical protein VEK38_00790, partial [Candidatus Bathyarchaeia archaeon]|nr:hypothetical protein [Candidatus Bathyarchaeia archaeon]
WATAVQKCQPLQEKYNAYFHNLQKENRLACTPASPQLILYNQAKKAHEKKCCGPTSQHAIRQSTAGGTE